MESLYIVFWFLYQVNALVYFFYFCFLFLRFYVFFVFFFFFQAEDGIRDRDVTGVQTCALPISLPFREPPGPQFPPRPRAAPRANTGSRPEYRFGVKVQQPGSPCYATPRFAA